MAARKRSRDESQEQAGTDIYIEGIPYASSEEELKALFAECGEITSLRAPRYQDSGRLRGYAHMTFSSAEAAAAALELNRTVIHGRYITVAYAKSRQRESSGTDRSRPSGCRTLFVKNLPYTTTEEEVAKAFAQYGTVDNARLARWGHTGRLKGFGYVTFSSGAAAQAAMEDAHNITVSDRSVTMDYDTGAPKSSFKTAEGRQWTKVHDAPASTAAGGGAALGEGERPKKAKRGKAAAEERKAAKAAAGEE